MEHNIPTVKDLCMFWVIQMVSLGLDTITHFLAFESSFFRSSLGTWAYTTQTNVRKCSTFGFSPIQASNGVIFSTAFVGLRFRRYTAVDSGSAHNLGESLVSVNIHSTVSTSVLFIRSATPFCSGIFGTVSS